jgi:hypothetical protein
LALSQQLSQHGEAQAITESKQAFNCGNVQIGLVPWLEQTDKTDYGTLKEWHLLCSSSLNWTSFYHLDGV